MLNSFFLSRYQKKKLYQMFGNGRDVTSVIGVIEYEMDHIKISPDRLTLGLYLYGMKNFNSVSRPKPECPNFFYYSVLLLFAALLLVYDVQFYQCYNDSSLTKRCHFQFFFVLFQNAMAPVLVAVLYHINFPGVQFDKARQRAWSQLISQLNEGARVEVEEVGKEIASSSIPLLLASPQYAKIIQAYFRLLAAAGESDTLIADARLSCLRF